MKLHKISTKSPIIWSLLLHLISETAGSNSFPRILNSGTKSLKNEDYSVAAQKEETSASSFGFLWKLFSTGEAFLTRTFFGSKTNSSRRTDYSKPQFYSHSHYSQEIFPSPEHSSNPSSSSYESSSGYHKTSPQHYPHPHSNHNPDHFYTLLGSLSFASFLATAVLLLTRRNGTIFTRGAQRTSLQQYLLNHRQAEVKLSGTERDEDETSKVDTDQQDQVFVKVPQVVHKISKILSPWWYYSYELDKGNGNSNGDKPEPKRKSGI